MMHGRENSLERKTALKNSLWQVREQKHATQGSAAHRASCFFGTAEREHNTARAGGPGCHVCMYTDTLDGSSVALARCAAAD